MSKHKIARRTSVLRVFLLGKNVIVEGDIFPITASNLCKEKLLAGKEPCRQALMTGAAAERRESYDKRPTGNVDNRI